MRFEKYQVDDAEVTIPIPETLKDCLTLINSDRYRISGRESSDIRIILGLVRHPYRSMLAWFRLAKFNGRFGAIFRYMYDISSSRYCVNIPYETKIGYGLYIGHKTCIIINENAVIGNNVNLSQFVNIGSNENKSALIGDNVYIGPNVSIVEDVVIGSNATIGAGAVVSKNIPTNSTSVGVPARPINFNNPSRYITNRWLI